MPKGAKSGYTVKPKRQAAHIEAGHEKTGIHTRIAEARAWATVNKFASGGKKNGTGPQGKKPLTGGMSK